MYPPLWFFILWDGWWLWNGLGLMSWKMGKPYPNYIYISYVYIENTYIYTPCIYINIYTYYVKRILVAKWLNRSVLSWSTLCLVIIVPQWLHNSILARLCSEYIHIYKYKAICIYCMYILCRSYIYICRSYIIYM